MFINLGKTFFTSSVKQCVNGKSNLLSTILTEGTHYAIGISLKEKIQEVLLSES